ncbi:glycosyltransferase [Parvularcula oceani]|uniref:glycosyltransferase n=1 Tax=Parvularcula oceani TaxID=1247963 RepID=UPI00138DFBC4|nr:glycosyltransferase [Parvularcula oceani]
MSKNARLIAEHLARRGWDVTVVTCVGGPPDPVLRGVRRVTLCEPEGKGGKRGSMLLRSVPDLRRWLKAHRPDIFLSAGNHAHLPSWLACAGLAGITPVYRISNDLRHGTARKDRFTGMRRRLAARLFSHGASQLILVSDALLDEPVFAAALGEGRVHLIRNGVCMNAVRTLAEAPCTHPWAAEEAPLVVALGRLAPQKNLPVLLHALAIARREAPLRLVILGKGTEGEREALLKLAGRLGIANAIDLPGVEENPFPLLSRASVFALPSLWEGSSNALLEALACGVPVVAARSAGNAAAVLDEGRYGLLVQPYDPEAMAQALLQQADPIRRLMPGRRADAFDLAATLDSYAELLEDLADPDQQLGQAEPSAT